MNKKKTNNMSRKEIREPLKRIVNELGTGFSLYENAKGFHVKYSVAANEVFNVFSIDPEENEAWRNAGFTAEVARITSAINFNGKIEDKSADKLWTWQD